jgi:hypothetical protein
MGERFRGTSLYTIPLAMCPLMLIRVIVGASLQMQQPSLPSFKHCEGRHERLHTGCNPALRLSDHIVWKEEMSKAPGIGLE